MSYTYWVEFARGRHIPNGPEGMRNGFPLTVEIPLHVDDQVEFTGGENYNVLAVWHTVMPTGAGQDHKNKGLAHVRLG